MSETCTFKVNVDERGAFLYQCTQRSPALIVDDQGDLNVNGQGMVELTLEMTGPSQFDGFLVEEDRTPSLQRGWTSEKTLDAFGMTPLEPTPWPQPESTYECKRLRFMLNIEEDTHAYHFRLVAKQGDQIVTYDPKIYNDPPTEPPPPLEKVTHWLQHAVKLEKRLQSWFGRPKD